MTTQTEEDLYRFAESSYVFDLPKDNEWDLRYPEYQIEYTVAVIKLWMESSYVLGAKEWQELSDDEIDDIIEKHKLMWMTVDFARAILAKAKEKNT